MKTTQDTKAMQERLASEDVQVRLAAVRRLPQLAAKLGPARTRDELFEVLLGATNDEADVLVALADAVQEVVEQASGAPDFPQCALGVLEELAGAEEAEVRAHTARVYVHLLESDLSDAAVIGFAASIDAMAHSEWYTLRSTAAAVLPSLLGLVHDETQADLRALYAALCRDEEPAVRRAAAAAFARTVAAVAAAAARAEAAPLLLALAHDPHDSVRLLAVAAAAALISRLHGATSAAAENEKKKSDDDEKKKKSNNDEKKNGEEEETAVLETVLGLGADKSWRVRCAVAEHFAGLCAGQGAAVLAERVLPVYTALLRDAEAEVRTAAAAQVGAVGAAVPAALVEARLLPCVRELAADASERVRCAVALAAPELAPRVGRAHSAAMVGDVVLPLLDDACSDVRVNVLARLHLVVRALGADGASQSLLPALTALAQHPQWRVRLAVLELLPVLAADFGLRTFAPALGELCVSWLHDSVHAVRTAAVAAIGKLTAVFGPEWTQTAILPSALLLHSNPCYLHRLTTLAVITQLAPLVGTPVATSTLLPIVLRMSQDRVPNVRFNVATTLQHMVPHLESDTVQRRVRPCLEYMIQDADNDVKLFATKALAVC